MIIEPIIPFEPVSTNEIPTGKEWIAQIKWDGVRMLIYFDGEETRLYNRKRNERTMQYPELTTPSTFSKAQSFILDGEIIAIENGVPSFHEVMKRDSIRRLDRISSVAKKIPITFMIFDILYLNGNWVTDEKLSYRQSLINDMIIPNQHIQIVPNFTDISALYNVAEQHHLEGIVIKNINSSYVINGKDQRWKKKKNYLDVNAVVGGVTYKDGAMNALMLGLYDNNGQLWCIGNAGSGKLKADEWRSLSILAKKLEITTMPFMNTKRTSNAHWLQPQLTVKVNFLEWTSNHTLRQPTIQAVIDVSPNECVFP
ncbi:DNA ligase [Paenibacillus selenitireducens]|uniref:DNA ligase (ATP) n=1 Tax=Paenibacillus selenitireducens TaxID=1324314 RepID=A0A1T2X4D9_9BACL|nr:RNA ligase family protein [Paenibacillus selenitireducens]OPA74556.1 DNA ligase [Paenibacillus selenitireducens]